MQTKQSPSMKPIVYQLVVINLLLTEFQLLTHLPLDKMAAISQTVFSDAFLWMKSLVFRLKFHWNLFLRAQSTITQYWFR